MVMQFQSLKVGALVCVSGVYTASIHAEEPAQTDVDAESRPIEETLVRGQYLQSSQIVIAMGHPLGATGSIMMGMLLDEMDRRDLTMGLVATSGAAGSGTAILVERLKY